MAKTEKAAAPRRKPNLLLSAVIAQLPDEGHEWPVDQQIAWLRMIAMAFGTVYGGDAIAQLGAVSTAIAQRTAAAPAKPEPKPWDGYGFYIDKDGVAYNANSQRVTSKQVSGAIKDLRGPDGDFGSILWADGSTGVAGRQLTITA